MTDFSDTIMFSKINDIDEVAQNVLQKRYFKDNETKWEDVSKRVSDHILKDSKTFSINDERLFRQLIDNRYFIPNSPCLVNAGTKNNGLLACFVVDFTDSIEGIYKTKLDFALIAKKGGGCGTTLSKIRPENEMVEGSTHGFAGGPVKFFDTICHDMEAMTQAGFREMAIMGTMSVYHPDILKFISAKEVEGKLRLSNISVVVDDIFMQKVKNNEEYFTYFDFPDGRKLYQKLNAKEVFDRIVEGAWKNGEPGIQFYNRINDSPYKYSKQEILGTNPCGEQPLPPNGSCNLGSLDISKFVDDGYIDWNRFSIAISLSVKFLDSVIDKTTYPTKEIEQWAKENRPIGLGAMGLADLFLKLEIPYGTEESLRLIKKVFSFMKEETEKTSINLGSLLGIPEACKVLPIPRRNITTLTIAPTGTIAILAGCNSGIEPVFSEITTRKDKTGTYQINHPEADKPYFRCAVSANGAEEVTWKEHILVQDTVQMFIDSGVSKTCNFPNHTRKETIAQAYFYAWELGHTKGLTVYRNGSRITEVLSPKNLKKDKCPVCGEDLIKESNCKHCSKCDYSICEIG